MDSAAWVLSRGVKRGGEEKVSQDERQILMLERQSDPL